MSMRYQGGFLTVSYNGLKAPDAPSIGTATAGSASASVAFTAPSNIGGGAITGYKVTSSPGGLTGTGTSSPITVSGLTNDTAYTFTVVATNTYGNSPASAASNSATPFASLPASVLLIAGGGPGGATDYGDGGGGGGGAGGLLYYGSETPKTPNGSDLTLTPGVVYTITIGGGGTGSAAGGTNTKGTNSTIAGSGFTTLTAFAGGRGGGYPNSGGDCSGGSGGGLYTGTTGSVAGQGNDGGASPSGSPYRGGGGGGAGAAGAQGSSPGTGIGGDGLAYSITGTSTYYAGGGGGTGRSGPATGGAGGGANGGTNNGGGNLGGGGGGGISQNSGNGGSGVCIIRSLYTAASATGDYTLTTDGSYKVYTFTSSGSITY